MKSDFQLFLEWIAMKLVKLSKDIKTYLFLIPTVFLIKAFVYKEKVSPITLVLYFLLVVVYYYSIGDWKHEYRKLISKRALKRAKEQIREKEKGF